MFIEDKWNYKANRTSHNHVSFLAGKAQPQPLHLWPTGYMCDSKDA
jgi:hypothetical protein